MVSSQQMNDVKASSSLHKCQMRPDDTAVRDWISDLTQNRCCYVLKYYTFLEITSSSRDYVKVPLLLFKIKSSLPGVEISFTYMFTSSAIASIAAFQPNLLHGALTHNNPKARSLMSRSNCCLILTKQHSPQLCATITVFCLPASCLKTIHIYIFSVIE